MEFKKLLDERDEAESKGTISIWEYLLALIFG